MQCPKCNSDNTQRIELIYSGGTQQISTQSTTVGGAHGGAFGIGGAVTSTSGQSQSLLAKQVAPPEKKSYKWPVISLFLGIAAFSVNSQNNLLGGLFLGALLGGGGAYLCYTRFMFNSKEWPDLYRHWQNLWHCHKCGMVYHHE